MTVTARTVFQPSHSLPGRTTQSDIPRSLTAPTRTIAVLGVINRLKPRPVMTSLSSAARARALTWRTMERR
jgi:hypothetical protein